MDLSEKIKGIAPSMTLEITAKTNELKARGERIISFGAGEPDFDTPEHIKAAAKDALDKGYTKYTAASGLPALKRAVCDKLERDNNLSYDPDRIVISNGAKHSIYNALYAVLNPGDEVIIPSPYWLTYPESVKCCDGVPVYVETTRESGFKMTAEQLEEAITPRTKALIFNSPNNPTGAVYDEAEVRQIADVCVRRGVTIVSDEIYEKLVYDGMAHFSPAQASEEAKELTILINGVSKSYAMTGWRLGYLAAPKNVAKAIGSFQSHATSNVNTMAQYAALAALQGDQRCVSEMAKAFERRRDTAVGMLEDMKARYGIDYVYPHGAFYIMIVLESLYGKSFEGNRIDGSLSAADLLLTHEKVAVTPGVCFGDDGCVRISYALSDEDLEEGLRKIGDFVSRAT